MKFVCQSCKAKYQIDDEKVAGRNLKMKCRKCGAVIPIPSIATSAGGAGPGPVTSSAENLADALKSSVSATAQASSAATSTGTKPRPAGPPPRTSAPPPRPAKPGASPGGATGPGSSPSSSAARGPERRITPPPRRAVAPSPGSRSSIVPRAPQAIAIAARGGAAAAARLDEVAMPQEPVPAALDERWSSMPPADGEVRPSVAPETAPGALTGAFEAALGVSGTQRARSDGASTPSPGRVSSPGSSGAAASGAAERASVPPTFSEPPASADAWFVGIDGAPTGPLTVQEIRAKAAEGLVHGESLVWREGFEGWLPLRDFPELRAAVEEGTGTSLLPGTAFVQPDPFAAPTPGSAPSSPKPSSPTASSPAASAPHTAPSPGAPASETASPSAASSPSKGAVTGTADDVPARETAPSAIAAGAAPPNAAAALRPEAGALGDASPEEALFPKRRSGMSPAVLFTVVVGIAFGLTLGFVIFGGEKTKVVREVVEVQVPAKEQAPEPVSVPAPPAEEAAAPAEEAAAPQSPTSPSKASSGQKVASAPASNTPQQGGLSGLSGLKGLASGPQAGPSTGSSASSAQPLDSSQIQSTVQRYTPSVRRSCWQPALDARDPNAPTSARVTMSITVGPDGKVRSASADGDPRGYPGLASCITQRVRTWTFPPSNGTTTVQVPFVFAAQ